VFPYPIKVEYGESGRNQIVLTPEFEQTVQLSNAFTNLQISVMRRVHSMAKPLRNMPLNAGLIIQSSCRHGQPGMSMVSNWVRPISSTIEFFLQISTRSVVEC